MAISPKALLKARAGVRPPDAIGVTAPSVAESGEGAQMGFLDHLEELRWRIIKAAAAIVICAGASLFFAEWVIDRLLLGPTRADFFMYEAFGMHAVDVVLQNRTVTGQFFAFIGTVLSAGLIIATPVVVFQVWRFLEPGLYAHEKEGLRFAAIAATFYFALGILFGYLILTPLALQFFAQFTISDVILNEFDISRYFSLVLTWTFGAGLLFELPVVVYFLSVIGVLTPQRLRVGRKYALIAILICAAFLTPPDPLSQLIMAVPLLGLYELSIYLSGRVEKKRLKAEAKALKAAAAREASGGE